jgi:hypothetical protein
MLLDLLFLVGYSVLTAAYIVKILMLLTHLL